MALTVWNLPDLGDYGDEWWRGTINISPHMISKKLFCGKLLGSIVLMTPYLGTIAMNVLLGFLKKSKPWKLTFPPKDSKIGSIKSDPTNRTFGSGSGGISKLNQSNMSLTLLERHLTAMTSSRPSNNSGGVTGPLRPLTWMKTTLSCWIIWTTPLTSLHLLAGTSETWLQKKEKRLRGQMAGSVKRSLVCLYPCLTFSQVISTRLSKVYTDGRSLSSVGGKSSFLNLVKIIPPWITGAPSA